METGAAECRTVNNARDYLHFLSEVKSGVIVIAAVKDTVGVCFDGDLAEEMKAIGFDASLVGAGWRGYIGIVDGGRIVYESLAERDQSEHYSGFIRRTALRKTPVIAVSRPWNNGNHCSIFIGDIDYSVNNRGLNIVVYDKSARRVIDSVCIDAHVPAHTFSRRPVDAIPDTSSVAQYDKVMQEIGRISKRIDTLSSTLAKLQNVNKRPLVDAATVAEYRGRLKLSSLLPGVYQDKIKIRIIYESGPHTWNTLRTLCRAFADDSRFQLVVIFYDKRQRREKEEVVARDGFEFAYYFGDYNIESDQPDIVVMTLPDDPFVYASEERERIGRSTKMFCVLPIVLVDTLFTKGPAEIAPQLIEHGLDFCFFDKLLYKYIEAKDKLSEHVVEMGNPKFDNIHNEINQDIEVPDNWKKFEGKPVILWAGDHGWKDCSVAFDQYAQGILSYLRANADVGLIFRPHPYYIWELTAKTGIWSQRDVSDLKSYFSSTPNIVWDDSPDYSLAYKTASAIITDVNCGITVSGLSTNKPLAVLLRRDCDVKLAHPELIGKLYNIADDRECRDFFDMIRRGEDPRRGEREQAFRDYVSHFDGGNGKRMKDFIVDEYFKKYRPSECRNRDDGNVAACPPAKDGGIE